MSAFLDENDLKTLTGYVKPSKQIEWLVREGIPHKVNSKGYPAVLRGMDKSPLPDLELGPVR